MSYTSGSKFANGTRPADVRAFVELLGFKKHGSWTHEGVRFEEYFWFDDQDYKSWSGVELTIYIDPEDGELAVSTRSVVARSYYDLAHQNNTIAALKRRFGGQFTTDAGRGRYFRPAFDPPPPAASGCHLAYSRFGSNLIKVLHYLQSLDFPNERKDSAAAMKFMRTESPRTLSNNMALSFLVSILEDYLKSTFISLLKYSPNKEKFFRNIRWQGDWLTRVASGEISVEAMAAETLSFQRISAACRQFQAIDNELDLGGALRRPYGRRQKCLFDSLEELVIARHDFVHRAKLQLEYSTEAIIQIIYDLEVAMGRIERAISSKYGWPRIDKSWGIGRRPRRS